MNDLISRQDAVDALDCINGTEEVLRSLPSAQNLEEVCAYLELCVEEAKDKAWGEGISFALCFIKKLLPSVQPEERTETHACDCISRRGAIDAFEDTTFTKNEIQRRLYGLPPAQPEPYLDSIVSEIEKTIIETKESGKHHDINVRANGEMICFGLQLALEIIEETSYGRSDIRTSGD